MDEEIIQWNVSMYNQCIYLHPRNIKQTYITWSIPKYTKLGYKELSLLRRFMYFLDWVNMASFKDYVNTRQMIIPVQKIIRNPAALIKDSILWIKTTTKKSQKSEFNEYWWHYFLWINSTTKSTKIKNKRVQMKPKIYIW